MPLLQTLTSSFGVTDTTQEFFIVPSLTSVNEGGSVTFNIYTNGVPDYTTVNFSTSGTIVSADSVNTLTGTLTIMNGTANVTFGFQNDLVTEGNETIGLVLRYPGPSGPIVGQSELVTVVDTSTQPYGSVLITGPRTYTSSNNLTSTVYWTVPTGVTSISIVAIGAGGGGTWTDTYLVGSGGGGGALSYRNNVTVTPGEQLRFQMGWPTASGYYVQPGDTIAFRASGSFIVGAQGGKMPWMGNPGTQTGTANSTPAYRLINSSGGYVTGNTYNAASHGGGQGGLGGSGLAGTYKGGGGGAGGYGSNGGNGGQSTAGTSGSNGSGGGGGGGSSSGGAGGGGNLFGTTTTYAGGSYGSVGGRGGGGTVPSNTGAGSWYGGGGAAAGSVQSSTYTYQYVGSPSAIRLVYPGTSRQFPSTDVANTTNTTTLYA